MKMRFPLLLLLSVLLALSAGCGRKKHVVTPTGGIPATAAQGKFTLKDMREAILKGCESAQWHTTEIDANTIEAMSSAGKGKHGAVVLIPYTATAYSINYKSSSNMKYESKDDGTATIHRGYNKLVRKLDEAIKAQLAPKQTPE